MPGSSLTCHMIRYRDCPASSKSSIIAGAISTAGGSRTAAAEHRYSTRSSKLSSLFMILPSSLQSGTSSIRTRAQAKSNNSRHSEDPFRPERASPAPTIINALQRVLFHGEKAETAVTLTSEKRAASHEWKLTEDERQTVMTRVCGVAENLTELRFMLAAAVRRTPSIAKYGMLGHYGMGDDVDDNPLVQMNQAECLLALYMLYKEGGNVGSAGGARRSVDFLDADRLEVLKGADSIDHDIELL